MKWEISAGRPVYLQLIEQMELAIISGVFAPGTRVPSVRDLAAEAGVNPNTMQRALQELEAHGLLQTQRTAGRSITQDTVLLQRLRQKQAVTLTQSYLQQLRTLGITREEARALLQNETSQPLEEE